MEIRLFGLTI